MTRSSSIMTRMVAKNANFESFLMLANKIYVACSASGCFPVLFRCGFILANSVAAGGGLQGRCLDCWHSQQVHKFLTTKLLYPQAFTCLVQSRLSKMSAIEAAWKETSKILSVEVCQRN